MIAKLEWTQSNAQQNLEQLQNPTVGVTINNESTTTEPDINGPAHDIFVLIKLSNNEGSVEPVQMHTCDGAFTVHIHKVWM